MTRGASASVQHPAGVPPVAACDVVRLSTTELNRLRWRCRRGMLENDLVLTRFLDQRAGSLTAGELDALDRLLALADDALWDLVCGRREPEDGGMLPVLAALRNA